jgi:hypothetical protein
MGIDYLIHHGWTLLWINILSNREADGQRSHDVQRIISLVDEHRDRSTQWTRATDLSSTNIVGNQRDDRHRSLVSKNRERWTRKSGTIHETIVSDFYVFKEWFFSFPKAMSDRWDDGPWVLTAYRMLSLMDECSYQSGTRLLLISKSRPKRLSRCPVWETTDEMINTISSTFMHDLSWQQTSATIHETVATELSIDSEWSLSLPNIGNTWRKQRDNRGGDQQWSINRQRTISLVAKHWEHLAKTSRQSRDRPRVIYRSTVNCLVTQHWE